MFSALKHEGVEMMRPKPGTKVDPKDKRFPTQQHHTGVNGIQKLKIMIFSGDSMKDKEVLKNTRCLVIGSMEKSREAGSNLRDYVETCLTPRNIKVWNHYKSPIECSINEGDNELFETFKELRDNEDFEGIAEFKQIRHNDLL